MTQESTLHAVNRQPTKERLIEDLFPCHKIVQKEKS